MALLARAQNISLEAEATTKNPLGELPSLSSKVSPATPQKGTLKDTSTWKTAPLGKFPRRGVAKTGYTCVKATRPGPERLAADPSAKSRLFWWV